MMSHKPGLSPEQYSQVNNTLIEAEEKFAALTKEIAMAYGAKAECTKQALRVRTILEKLAAAHNERVAKKIALGIELPETLSPFSLERHREVKENTRILLSMIGNIIPELSMGYGHSKPIVKLASELNNEIISLRFKLDAKLCDVTTSDEYMTERYDFNNKG
jgi:hypothetical protein